MDTKKFNNTKTSFNNEIGDNDEYKLLIGKYGFYFFNFRTNTDLSLLDVLAILNKSNKEV
jgi:hypothetical protein